MRVRARSGTSSAGSSSSQDFYEHVKTGYDRLAPSYDEEIGRNLVGIQMREVFRLVMLQAFRPGQRIFEIGCGTGIDAIWLARQGFDVVATDISEKMVAEVRHKADQEGLQERVRCRKMAAHEIATLSEEFGEGGFDGGFSHAGAMNAEPDLGAVSRGVRMLLPSGRRFVCSVINHTSLFELLFYPMVFRPRKAFRRLGNTIPIPISRKAPLNRYVVPTRFYSPNEIRGVFRKHFALESMQGLRILLPPSNLTDLYAALGPAFRPFELLEARLASLWPFKHWGHHTIMTFRRIG